METALKAVELIMDDDIDGAEKGLQDGDSAFHKLARGTLGFMRATMGFEPEVMKDASNLLWEAESTASASLYKAQHSSNAFQSNIYDKGSEFMLCQAEAQVMTAIVGVLNESLTESIKGFYRLRKAYMTLDSLTQMEVDFIKMRSVQSLSSSRQSSAEKLPLSTASSTSNIAHGRSEDAAQVKKPSALRNAEVVKESKDDQDSDSEEFYDADTANASNPVLDGYHGKVERAHDSDEQLVRELDELDFPAEAPQETELKLSRTATLGALTEDADSDVFSNSLDIFIHSGTNLMFGVLNLMISKQPVFCEERCMLTIYRYRPTSVYPIIVHRRLQRRSRTRYSNVVPGVEVLQCQWRHGRPRHLRILQWSGWVLRHPPGQRPKQP